MAAGRNQVLSAIMERLHASFRCETDKGAYRMIKGAVCNCSSLPVCHSVSYVSFRDKAEIKMLVLSFKTTTTTTLKKKKKTAFCV